MRAIEPARGARGAARGEHVVDDEHPLPRLDRPLVNLERVGAVLERVVLAQRGARQLARLANRYDAGRDLARNGAPMRKPRDSMHATCCASNGRAALTICFTRSVERGAVAQERRDVAKQNPLLREVGDVADQRFQVTHGALPSSASANREPARARVRFAPLLGDVRHVRTGRSLARRAQEIVEPRLVAAAPRARRARRRGSAPSPRAQAARPRAG